MDRSEDWTTGSVAYSRGLVGFRIHWGSSLALGWINLSPRCNKGAKGPCVTLYARTSGDVPRPWTSLGRPRTTPDVPARPGTSAWDVPARPGTVKTINKYLELVEHLYDEAVKKQNDEAKTVQRKQIISNKNTAESRTHHAW